MGHKKGNKNMIGEVQKGFFYALMYGLWFGMIISFIRFMVFSGIKR